MLGINNNDNIIVMKIVMDDMPPTLKLEKGKEAAKQNPIY